MGWKAACVAIARTPMPFLAERAAHDPDDARALVALLQRGSCVPGRMTTLDEAMNPEDDQLFVGAYPGGALICSWPVVSELIDKREGAVLQRLLKEDGGWVLAFALHSVVNLFGYALWENGRLRRAFAGSGDDGIFVNEGSWLPEELHLLERSEIRDGEAVFRIEINSEISEYIPIDQYGEEFTFEITRRVFERRMDEVDTDGVTVQRFEHRPTLLQRFGWGPSAGG